MKFYAEQDGFQTTPSNATFVKARIGSRLWRALNSLPALGAILFIFVTSFPPIEVATEVDLPIHMLQHVLIAIAGVMIGYPLFKRGRLDRIRSTRTGLFGFLVIASLLVFWHLPFAWDAAVLSLWAHILEHISFLFIGLLIGFAIPMLPDNFKMLILALAISAHMFYGFALFLITTPVYPLYPVDQQALLGVALFAPSPAYFVGYLYLTLTRENKKIERQELASLHTEYPPSPRFNPRRRGSIRLALPLLGILMIALLGGYFILTSFAIVDANPQNSLHVAYVYIEEGPLYWQYTPQNIKVVIGVNNTVVWISHSFTEDTVTSSDGSFSSGAIAPGGSFSYTFNQPGTYHYYCKYHLWMTGSITVLSGN